MKSESFFDYLKKEKQKFDRPRHIWQRYFGVLILVISGIGFIYSLDILVNLMVEIIRGTYEISSDDLFFKLGFPSEIIPVFNIGYLSAFAFASLLFGIIFCYFLTFSKRKWSKYHEQLLALLERLNKTVDIEKYIEFQEEEKRFQLSRMSIDWDIEWIFPFLFRYFPPLLFQIGVIAILFPIFIITLIPTINVVFSGLYLFDLADVIIVGYIIGLAFTIGIFFIYAYQKWRPYDYIRTSMINTQKEKINFLILKNAEEITIIRNQNNLIRIISIQSFPLPALFRISMIVPLVGSIIGYILTLFI
jgi:hypothetical protein